MKLRAFGIPLMRWRGDPRLNRDVGGRVVEMAETEYMVRGSGYLRARPTSRRSGAQGRERHAGADPRHRPVEMAPDERRGIAELNGEGEVVSGIAMARYGQNALEVIPQPEGQSRPRSPPVCRGRESIEAVYDRSDLIHRAIDTLKRTLAGGKPHRRRWSASSSCCTCARRWWPS